MLRCLRLGPLANYLRWRSTQAPAFLTFRSASSYSNRPLRAPTVTLVDIATRPRSGAVTHAAPAASGAVKIPVPPPTFEDLGLSVPLLKALEGLHITEPTEIQALAFPALGSGGNYMLASHTGSGKTLAYLLPLVQLMKAQEAEGFVPRPKRPRMLILGPTKELTEQITSVAKVLCHQAKFRATCINAYKSMREQEAMLGGPIDVVIATPTRFLQHMKDSNVFVRDIRWLVIDEADTIFAQGWGEEVKQILKPLQSKPEPASVVLVSATMTKPVKRLIAETLPDMKQLETSTLHKAVGGSRHQFLALPPGMDKLQQLSELLATDSKRERKTLVFCNTMDSCRAVQHFCSEEKVPCVCYHGEMPSAERQQAMQQFAATGSDTLGGPPIMIATDLAARGLDFPGQVDHVINFDFPQTSVDYLHRTGRTARAGHTGKITSIVTKRDKTLAQRIEYALQHDEPLDALNSNPQSLPPSQRATELRAKENAKARVRIAVMGKPGLRVKGPGSGFKSGPKSGSGSGEGAKAGGSGGAGSAKTVSRGPVRGAARFALMDERLKQMNEKHDKKRSGSRPQGRSPGKK